MRTTFGLLVVIGTASGLQLGVGRRAAIGGCIAALAPIAPSFAIVNPLDRGEVQVCPPSGACMETAVPDPASEAYCQ
jgi:hypothetical protein